MCPRGPAHSAGPGEVGRGVWSSDVPNMVICRSETLIFASWAPFCSSFCFQSRLWPILGPSSAVLGPVFGLCGHLELILGHRGLILGRLGTDLAHFMADLGLSETNFGLPGTALGSPFAELGLFSIDLGAFVADPQVICGCPWAV